VTTHVEIEIADQPACWRRAAQLAAANEVAGLPERGERVAVVGCGTSLFVARAYARLREDAGHGETDAFPASELPVGRRYDRMVALSRSGTTTEVLELLDRSRGTVAATAVTADQATPVVSAADQAIVLDFANERSVVQTRFATTALALFRAHLGEDLTGPISDAERAVHEPLPAEVADRTQFTFLGSGWTVGLADEAALKMREASLSWSESYPGMEYRHGPIAITGAGSVVWMFGRAPAGLAGEVAATGGLWVHQDLDPVASLITVQRLAVARGIARGLDPDVPRHLSRSVILRSASV